MNLSIVDDKTAEELRKVGYPYSQLQEGLVLKPTQAEVCKWLRSNYELYILIDFFINTKEEVKWWFTIAQPTIGYVQPDENQFNSYEKAELEGIKKGIEILRDK